MIRKTAILASLAILALATGCSPQTSQYAAPDRIEWNFEGVQRNTASIAKLEGKVDVIISRSIPQSIQSPVITDGEGSEVEFTDVAYSKPLAKPEPKFTQGQLDELEERLSQQIIDGNKVVAGQIAEATKAMTAQSVVSDPIVEAYSAPTDYTAPQTYSGPTSYGSARTSGYKSIQKTRRVAKTVYEDVPYEIKVPVMKRDIFRNVQSQVPYESSESYQETETRTRKVARTVYEDQQYNVSVTKTRPITKYRTVSQRVKVGEEEVPVSEPQYSEPPQYQAAPVCEPCQPVQSYSAPVQTFAEPVYSSEPVRFECQPSYSTSVYSAPVQSAPVRTAPPTFYSVASAPVAAPAYHQVFQSPAVFQSSAPATEAPIYQQPMVQSREIFNSYQASPQAFSFAPQQTFAAPARNQLMTSTPVATRGQPKMRPFATATKTFSNVRQANIQQSGGGLFQRGKPQQSCPNGACPLQ